MNAPIENFPRHSKGTAPRKLFTCPDCAIKFIAYTEHHGGSPGKRCPNGHWHTINRLDRYLKTGLMPKHMRQRRDPEIILAPIKPRSPHEPDATTALRWMLDSYDKIMRTVPNPSASRAIINGAFGHVPELARRILES
jgi:hypothetical protein